MISSSFGIGAVSKVTDALLGLYDTSSKKEDAMKGVEKLQSYFEAQPEVFSFLTDHFVPRESKMEIMGIIRKSGMEEYLVNSLCFLVDSNLIFHLRLFLSTLRTNLQKALNIQTVFVYSSFEIADVQKKKIEALWRARLPKLICEFVYAIDKSLKLGIKVQVGNYVEEFTVKTNLSLVELKLESELFNI